MIDRLLTIGEAAEMLGVSKWSMHNYIRGGSLKAVELPNGRKRVALSDIQSYIKTLKKEAIVRHLQITKTDDVEWSLNFVSKHSRFPSLEELARRKKIER